MSLRRRRPLFAWAAALALAAPAASASHGDAVLGSDGELYMVRAGAYGELFPGGDAAAPADPVLALEVVRPAAAAGSAERFLVPGTAGPEPENSPSILFEQASKTVFVVWESAFNVVHPSVRLVWFDGAAWSELIDVTGKPFTPKTSPLLAVTRDSREETSEEGEAVERNRTILHLLWVEEDAAGLDEVLYTPIVFEDGVYKGNTGYHRLARFDPSPPADVPAVSQGLLDAPTLERGRDGRTVVAGFAAAANRRVVTLEIDVLPGELVHLADRARAHIINIGTRFSAPGGHQNLAEAARAHIINIGRDFHPEVAQSLGDQLRAYLLANPGQELIPLADGARAHIINIGAKLSGRGLRQQTSALSAADEAAPLQEIIEVRGADAPYEPPLALLQVRLASSRPAPATGAGTRIFLSETGRDVLIAWPEEGRVLYRGSAGAGWDDTRELRLSPALPLERALEILEHRVRNR